MIDAIRATVVFSTNDDFEGTALRPFDYDHKSDAYLAKAHITLAAHDEYLPATAEGWRHKAAEMIRQIYGVRTLAVHSVLLHLVGER